MARAQPLIPVVCDPNRWIGGLGWSWWVDEEEEGGGLGAASVSTLNDSLGQPLLHMLSGEREARM